jgi:hypothetical protein
VLEEVRAFVADPRADRFEEIALGVFRFQFERNRLYRRFCERRGIDPGRVRRWEEIPAVPVSAFKRVSLEVEGLGEGRIFLTSGTTEGSSARGRHRVPDPEVYRLAALRHFEPWVLPDGARLRVLALTPSPRAEPHSSLVQMIAWVAEAFGRGDPEWLVEGGEVDDRRFTDCLREAETSREPLLLIGLTHAFVRFVDRCRAAGVTFRLPYGSRIVDTGGTKGRIRPVSRNGLLRSYWETFGVPGYFVANEYGMTEMCSQFYDSSIGDHYRGCGRPRRKVGPPWVRTQIVSPETLEPVAPGEPGLLRHFDLANVGSVCALQTEDLGIAVDGGFEVLGRVEGAEPRGCGLLLREVVP